MFKSIGARKEGSRRLTGFNTVQDLAKTGVVEVASPKKKQWANGTRHVRSQELRDLVILETTSLVLFEDSLARQQAKDAVQSTFIDLQVPSQIHGATPAAVEMIRDAQLGCGIERLMEDKPVSRMQQDCA
jgi:hypothetical protein